MSEVDNFEISLNNLLVDTFNNILKYEEKSLRTISNMRITVSEAHLIEAISRLGGKTTVSEIAAALGIAVPTATVSVKRLGDKGFIQKVPCVKDARRTIVSLTELGAKMDRAHSVFHRKMVRDISSDFSESEKTVLLSAINKLSGFFKNKVEA
jgi:DNA-binding MarR family transcriptional regulator